MRIRQVRPEFWSDPVTARLPVEVQLTYIALWNVCDDSGWLRWDTEAIGALIYPYLSVRGRERRLGKAREALTDTGRLVILECGCARIPTLPEHQKIGGNKSYTAREEHLAHGPVQTSMDEYPVTLGNVRVGNGRVRATADADLLAAFRRRGLPVDAS